MIELADGKATVLAVDNDPSDLEVMVCRLEGFGFQVVGCQDPEEAILQHFRLRDFCLAIFTDYNLSTNVPDMTGEQLAMLIRFDNPNVKICIASATDFRPDQLENFLVHRFYALRKPVMRENLGKVIGFMRAFEFPPFAKYYP